MSSASRRIYGKTDLRLLAGAPGSMAKPPNLLTAVDRSRYRGNQSPELPVSLKHKNQRHKHSSHSTNAMISPTHPKWKPKAFDRYSGQSNLNSRHWDHAPASSRAADEDEEEPEWADEPIDFTENFDFSQATLERDREKPAEPQPVFVTSLETEHTLHSMNPPVSSAMRSRFGFASDDATSVSCHRGSPLASYMANSPLHSSSVPAESVSDLNAPRQSRFKFAESNGNGPPKIPLASPKRQSSRFGVQLEPDSDDVPTRVNPTRTLSPVMPQELPSNQSSSIPKGKVVEVAEMFQVFAMASGMIAHNSSNNPPPQSKVHEPSRILMGGHLLHSHMGTHAMPTVHGGHSNSAADSPPTIPTTVQTLSHYPAPNLINNYHGSYQPHASAYHPAMSPAPTVYHPPPLRTSPMRLHPLLVPDSSGPPAQPNPTRATSHPADKSRKAQEDAKDTSGRPKPAVPAATAPPAYVMSYMNMQLHQQPASSGYYAPPGMPVHTGFVAGQHQYPPAPPQAPYR